MGRKKQPKFRNYDLEIAEDRRKTIEAIKRLTPKESVEIWAKVGLMTRTGKLTKWGKAVAWSVQQERLGKDPSTRNDRD